MSMKNTGQGAIAIYRLVDIERDVVAVDTLNGLLVLTHIAEVWHRRLGQWVCERNSGFYLAAIGQDRFVISIKAQRLDIINKIARHGQELRYTRVHSRISQQSHIWVAETTG